MPTHPPATNAGDLVLAIVVTGATLDEATQREIDRAIRATVLEQIAQLDLAGGFDITSAGALPAARSLLGRFLGLVLKSVEV